MYFSYTKYMKTTTTYLVQDSKGKYENWAAKSLGYGFRVDSFFPGSWGGGVYCSQSADKTLIHILTKVLTV